MFALDYRPSKRLQAAIKLAGVYSAGVTLLLALVITVDPSGRRLEALPFLGIPGAICFALAFLLLAVARRAGFTALWIIVSAFWIMGAARNFDPFETIGGFVTWSVFAAPLYAMCALGFRRRSSAPARWRRWISFAAWAAWAVLVAIAIRDIRLLDGYFAHAQYWGWGWRLFLQACVMVPPLITVAGILRVYRGTPAEVTTPAA